MKKGQVATCPFFIYCWLLFICLLTYNTTFNKVV
jgi:hypothetical protein